jgi:hypothetical protein
MSRSGESVQWSGAQPIDENRRRLSGTVSGTEDESVDALEARIRAAKAANQLYQRELAAETQNSSQKPPVGAKPTGNRTGAVEASALDDAIVPNTDAAAVDQREEFTDRHYEKFISEFKILTRDMANFLEKNKVSSHEAMSGEKISASNDAKKKEENIRRKEIKDKINSLLQQYDKSNDRIPIWRHRLRGNFMPRSDQVLKGRFLWRGIALAVFVMYAKPKVAVLVKKRNKKIADEENFSKTLLLFRDACNNWMSKLTRLPLISIQQVNRSLRSL